ncbi:3519_t:CDS:2, partial [Racocetra persica]
FSSSVNMFVDSLNAARILIRQSKVIVQTGQEIGKECDTTEDTDDDDERGRTWATSCKGKIRDNTLGIGAGGAENLAKGFIASPKFDTGERG